MQTIKNKTMAIMIALILTISMSTSIILTPTVNAHTPPWTITSYAYLVASPNPVGVGQTISICMWVDTPMPGATIENDIRRHDYKLTITNPDGAIETQTWQYIGDPTGVQFYRYTPIQVGNYTINFDYAEQTFTWGGSYQNDIFKGSNKTITLAVQEDPLPMPINSYPLPTEYWTRPIEGQNNYWYAIAANYLGEPFVFGANQGRPGSYQPDGLAPNSAHVMWTKPIQWGGVVGGIRTAIPGETFYAGLSYNTRFDNPLIMYGTLYYQEPYGNSKGGGDYVAVDLRTGQEQWRVNTTATGTNLTPSFGYLYSFESPNQHGVLPNGLLIATSGSTWRAYDPRTGVLTSMTITNVPSGSNVAGPLGEYLKYRLVNQGTSTNRIYNIMQWNSSKVFGAVAGTGVGTWYSGTANASLPSAYDWNVTLNLPPGSWSIGSDASGEPLVSYNNMMLLVQGNFGRRGSTDPGNITAVSLKPESLGQILWTRSYPQAPNDITRNINAWDPSSGIFIFTDKETFARWGYSLDDGTKVWGPTTTTDDNTNEWTFMLTRLDICAYGNVYYGGYSGIVYCFDVKTGELLWTYGNGGEGNNTSSGFVTPYGRYPTFIAQIADGKIYTVTDEHSPTSPMYKGGRIRCINATDGTEIWTLMGWGNQMNGIESAIADCYFAILNPYDMQIYSIGKGPSQLSVQVQNNVISQGGSVLIEGSVFDISAGTKQPEQAARFPAGVPAVSDASQTDWM